MTPKSLKIATYNVHGWFDGEGKHNLERVLQLYRKHSSQLSPSFSLQYGYCPYSHSSVGDPDPHVFGPPGSESGSISQRLWIRILSFSQKCVKRTEIMPAK
jgi:hypothetical protein